MAFTVTPTSGDAPYALSANIANSVNVNGVDYAASVTTTLSSGSCPASGSQFPLPANLVNLLVAGETVSSSYPTVPSGSCRALTLTITRVSDSVVIDSSTVTINNL